MTRSDRISFRIDERPQTERTVNCRWPSSKMHAAMVVILLSFCAVLALPGKEIFHIRAFVTSGLLRERFQGVTVKVLGSGEIVYSRSSTSSFQYLLIKATRTEQKER